jgi:hypothetical protein
VEEYFIGLLIKSNYSCHILLGYTALENIILFVGWSKLEVDT